jgi:hypothetical protein
VPAFRYRRLKFLLDLALKISRLKPSHGFLETAKDVELSGCYYDAEDASLLAQFTENALTAGSIEAFRKDRKNDLSFSGATLTWFPFPVQG